MNPKDEYIKITLDSKLIRKIAKEMVEELEQIDNEAVAKTAERIANES